MQKTSFRLIAYYLSIIVVFVSAGPTQAIEVADLYRVDMPVAEQSRSERWKTFVAGYREVLVRKSGTKNLLSHPVIVKSYSKVTNYLQKFEYSKNENDPEKPFILQMYFEPRLVDELIKSVSLPLWGNNRPLTMIWLAFEGETSREILKSGQEEMLTIDPEYLPAQLEASVLQQAKRRGVPVILPLMDLEDEVAISNSDVWGRFEAPVVNASARYQVDAEVFGRIVKDGESWTADFSLKNQERLSYFNQDGESLTALIALLTDALAEFLCEKYCVFAEQGESQSVYLSIDNIGSFKQFKSAETFLNEQTAVSSLNLISIAQRTALFKVDIVGQLDAFIDGIALASRMEKIEVETTPAKKDHSQPLNLDGVPINSLLKDGEADNLFENVLGAPDNENETNLQSENASAETDSQTQVFAKIPSQAPEQNKMEPLFSFRWVE